MFPYRGAVITLIILGIIGIVLLVTGVVIGEMNKSFGATENTLIVIGAIIIFFVVMFLIMLSVTWKHSYEKFRSERKET